MVHDIGHYTPMIKELESLGIGLVESVSDATNKSAVLTLSPHGHAPSVEDQILQEGRLAYDTTCPLVEKVEHFFDRYITNGDYFGVHYGKRSHIETKALVARAPDRVVVIENLEEAMAAEVPDPTKVLFTSQTTLLVSEAKRIADALRARGLQIKELPKGSICYATEDRQNSLKTAINQALEQTNGERVAVVVVGDTKSSNTTRLVELAQSYELKVLFVLQAAMLQKTDFKDASIVIITGGASVPHEKIDEAEKWFVQRGSTQIVKISATGAKDESRMNFKSTKVIDGTTRKIYTRSNWENGYPPVI